jgi:transketolase C-terminal domain/subunit
MTTAMRQMFEQSLIEITQKHKNLRVITVSKKLNPRLKKINDQNIYLGNAYRATIGIAAGHFLAGLSTIIYSPDTNIIPHAFFEIQELICRPKLNVKIIGPAHLEDQKLAHQLDNLRIVSPSSINDHNQLTQILRDDLGPTYIRINN